MSGYRIAEDVSDPLAADPALAASQKLKDQLVIHALVTVCTVGFWLPVVVGWLLLRSKGPLTGYRVEIRSGVLRFGTREESSAIPLETITGVHVTAGRLRIHVKGGRTQPTQHQVYGLVDPAAAADAILDARREHVASLGRARVEVDDEDAAYAGPHEEPRRARR